MTIETIINVKATASGGGSVKSIREEIKKAKEEAISLARQFGDFSPQAQAAAQKVAKLKDEMEDLNERVAGLNPDKFQAVASVVGGVASGIQAAQGAMALFGSESEEVQKTLLKVQGAMAFAQGIQQLISMQNALAGVATMIKTQVVTAFSTLKGAIMATGIGALIVGVGILIEHMNSLSAATEEAAAEADRLFSSQQKVTQLNEISHQLYINKLKARNATERDLHDANIKYQEDAIIRLQETAQLAGESRQKFDEEIYERRLQIQLAQSNFELKEEEKRQERDKQAQEKRLAQQKEYYDKQVAARLEFEAVIAELEEMVAERSRTSAEAAKDVTDQLYEYQNGVQAAQQRELQQWYEDQKALLIAGGAAAEEILKLQELRNIKSKEIDDKFYEEKKAADEKRYSEDVAAKKAADMAVEASDKAKTDALKKNQQDLYNGTVSALGSLSQLFGQQTKAGKAFALTQIGIDTARGISGAVAQAQSVPFPANLGAIAIGVSTVLANIASAKRILGASGGGVSAPSSGTTPQTFSVNNQALRISAPNGQYPMNRVYVLESDISNAQKRVNTNRQLSVY
jgi:hypothetical protein